jgi:hypothetical protein
MRKLLLSFLAPAAGIAAIVLFGIVTNPDITFNTESNVATSGGFGPNQVSAILGLGTLFAFFCQFAAPAGLAFRVVLFALMVWLAAQSALTFSRGGLFAASGAAAVASAYYAIRYPRARLALIAVAALVFATGKYVIWPQLDQFTEGNITARFTEKDLSRRDELGWADLTIWDEHPILGVGPGRSSIEHREEVITHTEFTRLLSEHGLFGAAAILILVFVAWQNVRRAASDRARGLGLAMITWSCLFMLNSAMRLAAPSFLFGLSSVSLLPLSGDERPAPAEPPGPRVRVPARRRQFVRA